MNIFEGSRRIAKLFAVLIVVGFAIAIFTARQEPVSVSYLITGPDVAPVRVDECGLNLTKASRDEIYEALRKADAIGDKAAAQKWATYIRSKTDVGQLPFDNSKEVVTRSGRRTNVNLCFKFPEVDMSAKLDLFKIPEADEGYITRSAWFEIAKSSGVILLQMLASLAGFWAFTWTIGWIVRGFMGIPRGQDRSSQP